MIAEMDCKSANGSHRHGAQTGQSRPEDARRMRVPISYGSMPPTPTALEVELLPADDHVLGGATHDGLLVRGGQAARETGLLEIHRDPEGAAGNVVHCACKGLGLTDAPCRVREYRLRDIGGGPESRTVDLQPVPAGGDFEGIFARVLV